MQKMAGLGVVLVALEPDGRITVRCELAVGLSEQRRLAESGGPHDQGAVRRAEHILGGRSQQQTAADQLVRRNNRRTESADSLRMTFHGDPYSGGPLSIQHEDRRCRTRAT